MENFSSLTKKSNKKKEPQINYTSKIFNVKSIDTWEFNDEADTIVILPHLTDFKEVLLKKELIPQYSQRDEREEYLLCITSTIREDEDLEKSVRRKLEEDCGFMLNPTYKNFEASHSLYKNKNTNSKYHFVYLPIEKTDYMKIRINGDRPNHENSSVPVRISDANIDGVRIDDIATAYALGLFKSMNE